jgi:3-deoxy-manno-octulosonate cytidylyltransferase (CMP-KDO synthetase)
MNPLGVIPARYASTRFPGKPLAPILGKPMVQWVWQRASLSKRVYPIIIATDDERILSAAESFNAPACITSSRHRNGMERAAEVAARFRPDSVVIIQGDEPLVRGPMLDVLAALLDEPNVAVASLMLRPQGRDLSSPNVVKVLVDGDGFAISFTRGEASGEGTYIHAGLYAYRTEVLRELAAMKPPALELETKLEQYRALCAGYRIKLAAVEGPLYAVDVPADAPIAAALLQGPPLPHLP